MQLHGRLCTCISKFFQAFLNVFHPAATLSGQAIDAIGRGPGRKLSFKAWLILVGCVWKVPLQWDTGRPALATLCSHGVTRLSKTNLWFSNFKNNLESQEANTPAATSVVLCTMDGTLATEQAAALNLWIVYIYIYQQESNKLHVRHTHNDLQQPDTRTELDGRNICDFWFYLVLVQHCK